MRFTLKHNLPFITIKAAYLGTSINIPDVLVDTGSATTILSADYLAKIKIHPLPDDTLFVIRGIGGSEVVFTRQLDYLQIGRNRLEQVNVEIGGMDYGFQINGILGMDYLLRAGTIINLHSLNIRFSSSRILPHPQS